MHCEKMTKPHVLPEVPRREREQPSAIWISLAIAFLILVWSLNYVVGKIGLRELPALALSSFRVVTAGIVSLPVLFLLRRGRRQGVKGELEVSKKPARARDEFWSSTHLGFVGVVVDHGCFTGG